MSLHRVTIVFEVDDEELAGHDSDRRPPPSDVEDWYVTDLLEAIRLGIATVEHALPEWYESVEK